MRNNDALYVVMGSSVAQIDQLRIIFWKSRELESEREKEYIDSSRYRSDNESL